MKKSLLLTTLIAGLTAVLRARRNPQPISLQNKVVIITGGSAGIGKAAAKIFAQEGANVVLVARRLEPLQQAMAEVGAAMIYSADVSDDQAVQGMINAVIEKYGRIDVLVNNAGLAYMYELDKMPVHRLKLMIDVNVYAPIRLTQLIIPIMKQQQSGTILNVSSMAGQIPVPAMSAYSSTRGAIAAFTKGVRRELAGSGIHIASVLPTWTATPMTQHTNEAAMRASGGLISTEKFDPPEKPAQAIVDAVRYRRDLTLMGGLQMRSGYVYERISPRIIDWFLANIVSIPDWIDAIKSE